MVNFFAENSKAIFTIISLVIIPSLFALKKGLISLRNSKRANVVERIIFSVDSLIDLRLHTQHHTRNKQAIQVENVVKSYAENVLAQTDDLMVLKKLFPHLSPKDLENYGCMYRTISKDVFYGPFFKKIISSIYDDQIHLMGNCEYERHIDIYSDSSFVFYWEKLREALPADFYPRIDEVKKELHKNMDSVEKFVRTMFDTGVAVALEETAKTEEKKDKIIADITENLLEII